MRLFWYYEQINSRKKRRSKLSKGIHSNPQKVTKWSISHFVLLFRLPFPIEGFHHKEVCVWLFLFLFLFLFHCFSFLLVFRTVVNTTLQCHRDKHQENEIMNRHSPSTVWCKARDNYNEIKKSWSSILQMSCEVKDHRLCECMKKKKKKKIKGIKQNQTFNFFDWIDWNNISQMVIWYSTTKDGKSSIS